MAADRHLLFGLLALQTGLIQQAQLVAAFHAWTCDKGQSLADHLITLGHLNTAQRAAIEALAALQIDARSGDVERSLADLPTDKDACESLANLSDPDIQATLDHVRSSHESTEQDRQPDADRTIDHFVGVATSNTQRFRILRPHARGGLGEVFVAVDGEINREVALKQILEERADDAFSRQRFIAEAQITGALEHPGVVPVYGLGSDAHGRPYYAMRFVKGDSLRAAIKQFRADRALEQDGGRRSLELRKLLRRFTDVCNAIDYAHSRGVIHRDIKPANIIVGEHGETLVVDWGLAKSVGRADPSVGDHTIAPSSSASTETLAGSALGTPPYMSPEQAAGELDRVGPRSDVYSLGATLYCLLTGEPPFQGEDVGLMLEAVREGRFRRPALRDPTLDKALEAVCLKAMATRPEDRYETPKALADDLDRWMADEPVTAWREPFPRRASRWLARHRTGVTALAAAVLAGVVGLCAVLAVQAAANVRMSQSLKRETDANAALATANAALKSSKAAVQARYDLAVAAIKTFHTGVSEDFLLKEDQFKELRNRLLKSASDFYGELAALLGKESDISSRRALAQSNFELAELTRKVGSAEAALTAHRAVLESREALAAELSADAGATADVARSQTAVAFLLNATGKADQALKGYRRSESLLVTLAGRDPAARAALADCRKELAHVLMDAGKSIEAMAAVKLARADHEMLAAAPGASDEARRDLAETVNLIGFHLWLRGKPAEAVPEYRTALALYQKLASDKSAVAEFRRGLAASHFYLGSVLTLTGETAEAETELRAALSLIQKLVEDYPAVSRFRRYVASTRHYLGNLLAMTGETSKAEAEDRAAIAILRKLLDDEPNLPEFRSLLAVCHTDLGMLMLQRGKPAKAEAECRAAVEIGEKVVADNPGVSIFKARVVISIAALGDVVLSLNRTPEAKVIYERAIAFEEPMDREDPTNGWNILAAAGLARRRGLTLRDLGDNAGAAAEFRRALVLCDQLPPRSGYEFEIACCHAALAGLAARARTGVSASEGEAEAARAMEWLGHAYAMGYRNVNQLRIEPALDPLRSRADFRLLMLDMAFPTKAFGL